VSTLTSTTETEVVGPYMPSSWLSHRGSRNNVANRQRHSFAREIGCEDVPKVTIGLYFLLDTHVLHIFYHFNHPSSFTELPSYVPNFFYLVFCYTLRMIFKNCSKYNILSDLLSHIFYFFFFFLFKLFHTLNKHLTIFVKLKIVHKKDLFSMCTFSPCWQNWQI